MSNDGDDGREEWTPDAEKPQRKSDVTREGTESSPPVEGGEELDDFDVELQRHDYPLTTDQLLDAHSHEAVQTDDGQRRLSELFEPASGETYGSPAEVRARIRELANRDL